MERQRSGNKMAKKKIDNFKGSFYLSNLDYQNEWQYTGASSGNANEKTFPNVSGFETSNLYVFPFLSSTQSKFSTSIAI